MKSKLIPVLVIYTIINSKKNYITGQTTRPDNLFMPFYNLDVQQAKPFVTAEEAAAYEKKIHNPFNRVFATEPAMVPAESLEPVKMPKGEKAEFQ